MTEKHVCISFKEAGIEFNFILQDPALKFFVNGISESRTQIVHILYTTSAFPNEHYVIMKKAIKLVIAS